MMKSYYYILVLISLILKSSWKVTANILSRGADPEYFENEFIDSSNLLQLQSYYKLSNPSKTIPQLSWENIVVIIMTYNDRNESLLINKHFETWISKVHTNDLDIIFVTDKNDPRKFKEILSLWRTVKPKIHLHKARIKTNEGSQARGKTIDSLRFAYDQFKAKPKYIYLKIDPDTFVIPEVLLEQVKFIHESTYPRAIDFGRVNCSPWKMCFTLGASYGINSLGLKQMLNYLEREQKKEGVDRPNSYDLPRSIDAMVKNSRDASHLLDEDYYTSLLFQVSTRETKPIHVKGMSIRLKERHYRIRGPLEGTWNPIHHFKGVSTIHLVKTPEEFDALHEFYYDEKGQMKNSTIATL